MAEHAAVNRRVASSSLARGANLKPDFLVRLLFYISLPISNISYQLDLELGYSGTLRPCVFARKHINLKLLNMDTPELRVLASLRENI